MARSATIARRTKETDIQVDLEVDGAGEYEVQTPIGFLSHMVEQLSKHGMFDLKVMARGDTHIDGHHTTEDLAIALGQAFVRALGDKTGIRRFGSATLPMDEACVTCALDLSGRPYFVWDMSLPKAKVGDFDSELAEVFFEGFARASQCNLHMRLHAGENLHHIIEISFKAFARALREATELDPRVRGIPSTKGMLTE